MKKFEIHADDSSDDEEIADIAEKYDIKSQHEKFLQNQNQEYKNNDPQGYSFLAYALGVKQFYSDRINKVYYKKKAELGKTVVNVGNATLKEWLASTLESTVHNVFELPKQKEITSQIANDFINPYPDVIKNLSEDWIKNNLSVFLKQHHARIMTPEIENCLTVFQEAINEFINDLELEKDVLATSEFFIFDDFYLTTRSYMEIFLQSNGLIRPGGNFALKNNWPRVVAKDSIEEIMVEGANDYNGHQNINSITTSFAKSVWIALLEDELACGKRSIIEKFGKKYRLKMNVTEQLIKASHINSLFSKKNMRIYLPYNIEKLKNELLDKFNKDFKSEFIEELKKKQKQFKIKLNRAITPQQYTFVSNDADDLQANLRLSMRLARRRIRQARDDEGRVIISGETIHTAWQFGEQKFVALETQEISTKGARNDQVNNLETYARINTTLLELKKNINNNLKDIPKINDPLIARWIREIANQGKLTSKRTVAGQNETSFENIPEEFKKIFLKFIVNFSYLLLGCEVQRNPASLVIHQMALDLIDEKQLTWTQAISDSENEKNFGGGAIPMTMGGYKKIDDEKATAHPVSCARALHTYYGNFAVKSWRYDGEDSTKKPNNMELVKRESQLVISWLTFYKLHDKPLEEKITAIEQAINTRWYPPRAK